MKQYKVKNVWGYPALNSDIRARLQKHGLEVVLGLYPFLKSKRTGKPTVIVDSLAVLDASGIPILGYLYANGVYVKTEWQRDLNNHVVVKPLTFRGRRTRPYPDLEDFIAVADCPRDKLPRLFKKWETRIAEPTTASDKWIRRVYMEYRKHAKASKSSE